MVFVIGASGFIGRYVVEELLRQKYEIVVLVRNIKTYKKIGEEYVIEGNMNNFIEWCQQLERYTIDSCVHLAWEGIPDFSYDMSKKNLLYGMSVLEMCREVGIKHIVITGSCGEYEKARGNVLESGTLGSENHFKAAKNSFRFICDAFCREYGIQYNWLRLFYVYGPGQRKDSLIPYIIRCLSQGLQPVLNGAFNENDFIYVADVADAIVKVVEKKPKNNLMNIGTGHAVKVKDIVEIAAKNLGCEINEENYKKQDEICSFYGDVTLANKILGWKACTSIEKGVAACCNEYFMK